MEPSTPVYGSDAHLRSLLEASRAFFAANPARRLYAGFVGMNDKGGWEFIIFDPKWMAGQFTFTPPNDTLSREQFQAILNGEERGEELLTAWAKESAGSVHLAQAAALAEVLEDVPTSPTRH
ncbi:hypothetical protein [Burkholderia gladioli]|uniref:hypothetical protein n=1 Tax=Burkholderia gladioli TaxID=28095 RepID=UPI0016415F6D|nr:hypothetical protein [Burkholderia gladioli]